MMHTPMEIMVRVAVMMAVIGAVVVALCYAGAVPWRLCWPEKARAARLPTLPPPKRPSTSRIRAWPRLRAKGCAVLLPESAPARNRPSRWLWPRC